MPNDGDVNYSSYSNAELLEAFQGINSKLYPENHRNLTEELRSRGVPVRPLAPPQPETLADAAFARAPRPMEVQVSVLLLAVALVTGAAQAITALRKLPDPAITLWLTYGIAALNLWVLYKIWTGRNWARILFTVLFALGLLRTAPLLIKNSLPHGSVGVVLVVVQVLALIGLFLAPSNKWFRRIGV
jgi:hypothetical protein